MRQRRSQHFGLHNRLAAAAARVDARHLDELRDRRDPSPGACAIGADIASAAVGGAVEERAGERGGLDAQSGGGRKRLA
jgi:hypothetical protein